MPDRSGRNLLNENPAGDQRDWWDLIPIAIGKPPTHIFRTWLTNLFCNIIYPVDARLIWQKSIK